MNSLNLRRGAAAATIVLGLGAAACVPEPAPQAPVTTLPEETTSTTQPEETTSTTEAPAFVPAVSFTNTTNIAPGTSVTITGTGFDPALVAGGVSGVYAAIGIGDGPMPVAFTSAKFIRPSFSQPAETASGAKLNADGSFSATISAVPLFTGQAPGQPTASTANCYVDACKIYVWSAHTGTLPQWTFSAPVTFSAPTSPIVHVSKVKDLGAEETVTVTGAGFATNYPGLYVWQAPYTDANKPSDWTTNSANTNGAAYLAPSSLAGGVFRTTVAVKDIIGTANTDCRVEQCTIVTLKAHGQASVDSSQNTWTNLAFKAAPVG